MLAAAGHSPDQLASIIYRPLYEKEASKAITAQYAAHLLSTGDYGAGDELFNRLPPYLQRALDHLTIAPSPKPAPKPGGEPPSPAGAPLGPALAVPAPAPTAMGTGKS